MPPRVRPAPTTAIVRGRKKGVRVGGDTRGDSTAASVVMMRRAMVHVAGHHANAGHGGVRKRRAAARRAVFRAPAEIPPILTFETEPPAIAPAMARYSTMAMALQKSGQRPTCR